MLGGAKSKRSSSLHQPLHRIVKIFKRRTMFLKCAAYGAIGATLWLYFQLNAWIVLLCLLTTYLSTGGWRFAWIFIRTCKRDVSALCIMLYVKLCIKNLRKNKGSIPYLFKKTVAKYHNKAAFICDGRAWTFNQVDQASNAIANYFFEAGYRPGDVVAIFMESRPEFVCLWLGLAKIGVIPSLINFNLRKESLLHCIRACHAQAVIYGSELSAALLEVMPSFEKSVKLYCSGPYDNNLIMATPLDLIMEQGSTHPPVYNHTFNFNDKLFYIYTSGTTGLPKPAVVIHSRYYYMSKSLQLFFGMTDKDVIYDTLPLYHTAGGILGVGQALLNGSTVVVRRKFSASNFWTDCVQYQCTVIQYIGEICRYLLAQPFRPAETSHKVRIAFGNGLRPQIWKEFMSRFNIQRIGEFYGATEGNANLVNTDNTVGAVGFLTQIASFLYPVTLIRVDENGEPIRNKRGLCIKCGPEQPGELVGKIIKGDPLREFDGYADQKATQKKVARDVFSKGDSAFLTGDVCVMDKFGYLYFRDRTGDTFRWRGENVSTFEVEATISNIVKLEQAVVYGVEIPGVEGRAGMAAIVDPSHTLDMAWFSQQMNKSGLPAYARPVFVRLLEHVETTGTFKLKKVDLQKKGFDPSHTSDTIYYMDKSGQYLKLDGHAHSAISMGKIRF